MGFTPDSGSSWLIPRLVGVARAKEMLLLGREVSGARASEWGLVHASVPADAVAGAAEALVAELASAATVATTAPAPTRSFGILICSLPSKPEFKDSG